MKKKQITRQEHMLTFFIAKRGNRNNAIELMELNLMKSANNSLKETVERNR